MTPIYKPYSEARRLIRDSDLLLFRHRPTWMSRIIAAAGRGRWSHAAIAVWWRPGDTSIRPVLLCCESREFKGARAVTLSSQVRESDRLIDVFRPDVLRWPEFNPMATAAHILRKAGTPYNYRGLWQVAKLHLPFTQLWNTPNLDDSTPDGVAEFCSQAASEAYRAGGCDPVVNLSDSCTEPSDLARSELFQYQFTLTV